VALLATFLAGAACRTGEVRGGPPLIQPGAPGQPGRVITSEQAVGLSRTAVTGADVAFMQGMIGHHQQAIVMTDLLASRTASEEMKKLALRISLSQEDEIRMMTRWLELHQQPVPGAAATHVHGDALMPGMLTETEIERLSSATGVEFDRLFLEGMIKHHGGALTMVKQLFEAPGAGQDGDIFAFASEVDADQRIEIERMSAMLEELRK
jgi:uncharacterized protein (DUF305 family)